MSIIPPELLQRNPYERLLLRLNVLIQERSTSRRNKQVSRSLLPHTVTLVEQLRSNLTVVKTLEVCRLDFFDITVEPHRWRVGFPPEDLGNVFLLRDEFLRWDYAALVVYAEEGAENGVEDYPGDDPDFCEALGDVD